MLAVNASHEVLYHTCVGMIHSGVYTLHSCPEMITPCGYTTYFIFMNPKRTFLHFRARVIPYMLIFSTTERYLYIYKVYTSLLFRDLCAFIHILLQTRFVALARGCSLSTRFVWSQMHTTTKVLRKLGLPTVHACAQGERYRYGAGGCGSRGRREGPYKGGKNRPCFRGLINPGECWHISDGQIIYR